MSDATMTGETKPDRKGVWGWMFFDWAAQPFFTVMTTFIFGPYVVSRVASDPVSGQAAWATSVAIAGLVIALLSPVLGAIADKTGPRKPWIGVFAIIKITCLCLLWYAEPGSNLVWVLGLFIIATAAAEFSIVFNDSMMSSLVSPREVGKISNIAWGLGYLGGMIVLLTVLFLIAADLKSGLTFLGNEPIFGLDVSKGEDGRATAPMSALWYLIFVIPMFLFTPDKMVRKISYKDAITKGLSELKNTFYEAKQRVGIFKFLIARMIYQDGVNALLALGGTFAAGMFEWSLIELGIFGIILNIVAIPSCFAAAYFDTWFGSKRVVVTCVVLLVIATLGIISTDTGYTLFGLISFEAGSSTGLFSTPAEQAYIIISLLIGIAFGPVQASSRAYLARSITQQESGRYFGLYAFVGRATSFLAPAGVAYVTFVTDSTRIGMSALIVFFVVGLILLLNTPYPADTVNENE